MFHPSESFLLSLNFYFILLFTHRYWFIIAHIGQVGKLVDIPSLLFGMLPMLFGWLGFGLLGNGLHFGLLEVMGYVLDSRVLLRQQDAV